MLWRAWAQFDELVGIKGTCRHSHFYQATSYSNVINIAGNGLVEVAELCGLCLTPKHCVDKFGVIAEHASIDARGLGRIAVVPNLGS